MSSKPRNTFLSSLIPAASSPGAVPAQGTPTNVLRQQNSVEIYEYENSFISLDQHFRTKSCTARKCGYDKNLVVAAKTTTTHADEFFEANDDALAAVASEMDTEAEYLDEAEDADVEDFASVMGTEDEFVDEAVASEMDTETEYLDEAEDADVDQPEAQGVLNGVKNFANLVAFNNFSEAVQKFALETCEKVSRLIEEHDNEL